MPPSRPSAKARAGGLPQSTGAGPDEQGLDAMPLVIRSYNRALRTCAGPSPPRSVLGLFQRTVLRSAPRGIRFWIEVHQHARFRHIGNGRAVRSDREAMFPPVQEPGKAA